MSASFPVQVDHSQTITAVEYPPAGAPIAALILGHGAGANQHHPFMVDIASALARRGVRAITFNFPYTEQGRSIPDRQPILERCYAKVIATVAEREGPLPLFIGGKSLGGRMASHMGALGPSSVVAQRIRGLVFLGYPLHPPGKEHQLRDQHLYSLTLPMLFISGTKDTFARRDLLEAVVRKIGDLATLIWVEGGDHSLKRSRTDKDSLVSAVDTLDQWIRAQF